MTLLVIVLLLIPTLPALGQGGDPYSGTIDDGQPYVRIPFTVPEDGMTIVADMAPPEDGELDTLLYLLDDQDNILAENDDREKGDSSSLITFYQADAGNYSLIATRYKVADGGSSGEFNLTIELRQGIETPEFHTATADLEAAGFPSQEPRPEAEWTVLAYYGGDNNLEPGILYDLDEFEVGGGTTDQVNVIALVDRHPRYTNTNGDWTTARLYEIAADVTGDHDDEDVFPPTIDTVELTDLGEVDTSNGETFAQFLVWAITHYPAQHYVIAFGSHGAAWNGLITDDTTEGDTHAILTVPELQQAFALATEAAGVERFDLLINDACLMSSVEYFAGVAPFFEYALASPEVVVDPALDMTVLLETLNQADEVDLEAAGIELVDLYIERDVPLRGTSEIVYLTHAVFNLHKFDPVVDAVEHFARVINRRPASYSTLIGDVRTNTYAYTEFLGEQIRVDIGSFMRGIIANSTDAALIGAAEDVLQTMDDARVYENAGERALAANLSYYNIYFPDRSKDFKNVYFEQSPLQEWGKMLRNYYNMVTPQVWTGVEAELGFHLPAAPQITITRAFPPDEASVMDPVSLELELVGRRISYGDATVDYVLEDGTVLRYSGERILTDVEVDGRLQRLNVWKSGVQHVPWFWDVTLPVISDGTDEFNELLILKEDVAFLDGRYREPGDAIWNDVAVLFDVNAALTGGDVQRVINRAEDTNALAVIDIAPGSEFQTYRSVVTPEGRVVQEPGNTYIWPETGLAWRWQPAPTGEYNLGLLITTFGGTTGFASKTVHIDNTGIDPTLRGRTISNYMVTVPTRSGWDRWLFDNDNRWYRTARPDGADNLTIYFSTDYGPDLEDIADRF
ncbi:MAG: hypothetical protein K8S97_11920, partial [Anaerolineae bacterium]|nr:hypothetical protein [Anaerolineae bacterium]